jgi:transcriptional regulator with GAF, ATPase, and Fis domain
MKRDDGNAMLGIAKTMAIIEGITDDNTNPTLQSLSQKISEELDVTRVVIFKLRDDGTIELVAGIPKDEHECDFGRGESITNHPDIKDAVASGRRVTRISNPRESLFTQYFRGIVEQRDIAEILYALVSSLDGKVIGVVVIDAVGEKSFSESEIRFCGYVAELITYIIDCEEGAIQDMRDVVINKAIPLRVMALRLKKQTEEAIRLVNLILKEMPPSSKGNLRLRELQSLAGAMLETADVVAEGARLIEKACPLKNGILSG